jgi:dolichol-phosphate mannosyltransferase
MKPELSLVIPTYNERENIEEILRATIDALGRRAFEVIVVDDNSPDRTGEIVERVAATTPSIRLVRRMEAVRDQAHSIMEGFRVSSGAILGKMDADGSHEPQALGQLLAAIDAGFEVAVGSRYSPGGSISSWPLPRRILSRVSAALVRIAVPLDIEDPLSGFWMIRREVYERAAKFPVSKGFKVLLQLCVRGHARKIAEVPIHFRDRTRGHTKLRAQLLFQGLATVISLAAANLHRSAKEGMHDD